jgi:hypothetical protein
MECFTKVVLESDFGWPSWEDWNDSYVEDGETTSIDIWENWIYENIEECRKSYKPTKIFMKVVLAEAAKEIAATRAA